MNKDTLKKHHFWILAGLAPLFVLIAVIMVSSEVGGAIDKAEAEIKKAKDGIANKTPKSDATIAQLDKQVDLLREKQTALWKENWERQIGVTAKKDAADKVVKDGDKVVLTQDPDKNLLRWPTRSQLLTRFNYTTDYATDPNQLKFGDRIPDDQGEDEEFKKLEVYLAEFANPQKNGMADLVAPTTFANGWYNVLRHVRYSQSGAEGWGTQKPKSEQLWLALEDIWVQRAILGAVRTVNEDIGRFAPVQRAAGQPDAPLERSFQSRVWRIDLKVAQQAAGGKYVITGVLTNLTDQLQLLGDKNGMTLNLWLSDGPNAQPVPFRVSGEFVPGRGAKREVKRADGQVETVDANVYPVVQTEEHVLPLGTPVEKIAKVEQVFDTKTVPVRQINRVALGKCDSRHAPLQSSLKLPGLETGFPYYRKLDADLTVAAAPAAGATPAAAPAPPAAGEGGKGPLAAAIQPQMEGGGDVGPVLDGNRKRYIEVTPQVRRMPVAVVLVVDQAYIQDVLLSYANCPLRFQITQFHWQRFRGTLGTTVGPDGRPLLPGSPVGPGSPGYPLDDQPQLTAPGTAGGGFGFGPAAGGGFGFPPGAGTPGVGTEFDPTRPGAYGRGGSLTTIAEGQQTAGLVELSVYGIVSLYEKYSDAPPAAADAAGPAGTAAPAGAAPTPAPMPK